MDLLGNGGRGTGVTDAQAARRPGRPAATPITVLRGMFWITGEPVEVGGSVAQRGPMYVEWESLVEPTADVPLVLVHGGGGQGTDWKGTPDGRPGWADIFVRQGFEVFIVDRPGHGRSPHHPDVMGAPGAPFTAAGVQRVFAPAGNESHTQWPWERAPGGAEFDQFLASAGFMLQDVAAAQELEARRLAALLERIGPAVLVTHSAGAPAGWLAAQQAPGLVAGIVAIEPQSPPFGSRSGVGDMVWGISAAPMGYEPPVAAAVELERPLPHRRIPGLIEVPVLVITGAASDAFRRTAPAMVDFLRDAGAHASWVDLGDLGIDGNGHGLMLEANSDETIRPVIQWLRTTQLGADPTASVSRLTVDPGASRA